MESTYKYPIAEVFESVQGEGAQAGIPMAFLRLAGCTVGKAYTDAARKELGLEGFQDRCTNWNGESFACDTNYCVKQRLLTSEILALPEIKNAIWVSLTGGEPLMHPVADLITTLWQAKKKVHIETSGTIYLDMAGTDGFHLTVSPKQGCRTEMLSLADEIRVLVDSSFDEAKFLTMFTPWLNKIWLSPVNNLVTLDHDNVHRCLKLLQVHKQLRLTSQYHKIWSVR